MTRFTWFCLLVLVAATAFAQEADPSAATLTAQGEAVPETAGEEVSEKVTLDFKDADIQNVLRILSLKSGVNIVAGPEVEGTVTLRLSDVPWERALEVVLRTYGYVYEREGNIIRVTTREKVSQEDLITETFVLNYVTAEEVKEAMQEMLSERGRIKAFNRTNTVIVTDVASNIFKMSQVVKRLDKPTPQAAIDARIVRTELGLTENLGIEWNIVGGIASGAIRPHQFPFGTSTSDTTDMLGTIPGQFFPRLSGTTTGGSTTTTSITANTSDPRAFPFPSPQVSNDSFTFGRLDFSSFAAVLNFLKTRSNTKIVSNPRIVVLNNQKAKVQVGDQIPMPRFERNETSGSFEVTGFDFRDVGVILEVTPHINEAEEILVDLKPQVSSEGSLLTFSNNLAAPRFTVTTAETQVLIKDGETIAIGGLLTDNSTITQRKVPILGDIPFLGKLFRSKRQSAGSSNNKVETLFFITISIIDTEGQPVYHVTTGP
jgi:type IV pilus assembly protein PilQ